MDLYKVGIDGVTWDKADFREKKMSRVKDQHIVIIGSTHQEETQL